MLNEKITNNNPDLLTNELVSQRFSVLNITVLYYRQHKESDNILFYMQKKKLEERDVNNDEFLEKPFVQTCVQWYDHLSYLYVGLYYTNTFTCLIYTGHWLRRIRAHLVVFPLTFSPRPSIHG